MLELILMLALIGFVVYLVITYIPMPEPFKMGIIVIVVIVLVIYLVKMFGLDFPLPSRR